MLPPPKNEDYVSDSYTTVRTFMVVWFNAITCYYSLLHVSALYGP